MHINKITVISPFVYNPCWLPLCFLMQQLMICANLQIFWNKVN